MPFDSALCFMISYELAKKLKDAGFQIPYIHKGDFHEFVLGEGKLYLPTLSELIEACGDGFVSLIAPTGENTNWSAKGGNDEYSYHEFGVTPEEAVTNLYLAISQK